MGQFISSPATRMDRLLKKVHWPHGIRHMPGDFFIGSFSSFCAKSRRPGCSVHETHQEEGTLEKTLWSYLCSRSPLSYV